MNLSKYQSKNSILFLIPSIAIFLGITSVNSANSYALTYESQAGIGFTINDTIKLSITGDIAIPELFPGNTEESNVINIKVSTNTKNGYSLSAKMGTTSTDLTTTSSSPKFTGLPTDASESTLADNTWGYKTKTSDGAWSNYSGLPISTDTEKILVERNSQPTGGEETTQFKIGAHASTSMPANTYSNTIIFHAVAKPASVTITWNANGGAVNPTTSNVEYGAAIGTLPTPTYEGHNFLGWFTEAEGGEEVTAETKVTKDVTYYARWEEAVKIISFSACGGGFVIHCNQDNRITYYAEEGMTWGEFVNSAYNHDHKFETNGEQHNYIKYNGMCHVNTPLLNDLIQENYIYEFTEICASDAPIIIDPDDPGEIVIIPE